MSWIFGYIIGMPLWVTCGLLPILHNFSKTASVTLKVGFAIGVSLSLISLFKFAASFRLIEEIPADMFRPAAIALAFVIVFIAIWIRYLFHIANKSTEKNDYLDAVPSTLKPY